MVSSLETDCEAVWKNEAGVVGGQEGLGDSVGAWGGRAVRTDADNRMCHVGAHSDGMRVMAVGVLVEHALLPFGHGFLLEATGGRVVIKNTG